MRVRCVLVATLMLAASTVPARGQVPADPLAAVYARLDALEQENQSLRAAVLDRLPPAASSSRGILPAGFEEAAAGTLEQRVAALEAEQQEQAEAAAEKVAADALEPTQRWTGRIHTDYWAFPHTSPGANAFENGDPGESVRDRFLFRRVRIGIQGDIPDNMLYKLEVDFNSPDAVQLKDNYIGWEDLPWLGTVQVGIQKRPYGLDHLNSSRFNVFLERPAIIEAINQDARRFGICSYGVSEDLAFNWRLGGYMSQDIQNLGTVMATPLLEDYQAELAGRFANTIWYDEASEGRSYAHWAISGTTASTDPAGGSTSTARFRTRPEARTQARWLDTGAIPGADHYHLLALEGVLNVGPVQWVGEYQQIWMQRVSGDPDVEFQGGYIYVSYFLTGESMAWDRETGQLDRVHPFENFFLVDTCHDGVQAGWGAWQTAVRYSHADLTDLDVLGGVSNEITFALNWYWNPYAKLQFNAIYGEIDDRRPVAGQTDAQFTILGARMAVDF